jgi:hypothetical protein
MEPVLPDTVISFFDGFPFTFSAAVATCSNTFWSAPSSLSLSSSEVDGKLPGIGEIEKRSDYRRVPKRSCQTRVYPRPYEVKLQEHYREVA